MFPGSDRRLPRRRGTTKRGVIVDAALTVADEAGLEGVTIRAVARRADVPTMSLYSHFASKEVLLDLMYSEFLLRLYGEELPSTWQTGLLAISGRVRTLLVEHPRWIELLSRAAQPLQTPVREKLLELMSADGMTPPQALSVLASMILMAEGLMVLEFSLLEAAGHSRIGHRFERMKAWADTPAAALAPTTKAAFLASRPFDFAENFAFTLENYVAGLEATVKSGGVRATRPAG